MRTIFVVSAAALALCACQKSTSGANTATASADTAAAQPAAATTAAGLGGMPHQRAGLWQTSMTKDGQAMPMGAVKLCVDDAYAARMNPFKGPSLERNAEAAAERPDCTRSGPTHNPDGTWSFTQTCQIPGGGQSVNKGTVSGDWSTSYHVDFVRDVTGSPVPDRNGHHEIVTTGTWTGPCPAGMAGGDVQLANGMSLNSGRLAAAAAMLRAHGGGAAPGGQ